MAEDSRFWTTDGTGDGPSGGYSQQKWYDFFRKLYTTDQQATEGVIPLEANELAVSGTASPLSVNTGSAIVYGFFYENTASLDLTVTTPAATTGGHVILEANWTSQTVRASAVLNTSGVETPPSLTQTAGTVWQIRLATFTITDTGVITLTDARSYAHMGTKVSTDMIDSNAITSAKIRQSAATSVIGRAGNSTGNIADIQASSNDTLLARTSSALAFQQLTVGMIPDTTITEAKLATAVSDQLVTGGDSHDHSGGDGATIPVGGLTDASITEAKLATAVSDQLVTGGDSHDHSGGDGAQIPTAGIENDAVDDTKVGNRVPQFYRRQGGGASSWCVGGTTTYTPTTVRMQAGVYDAGIVTGPSNNTFSITFPTAFSNTPIVTATIYSDSDVPSIQSSVSVYSISASGFSIDIHAITTGSEDFSVTWIAIGPE